MSIFVVSMQSNRIVTNVKLCVMREKRASLLMLGIAAVQMVFADYNFNGGGWYDPEWQRVVEDGAGVPY